MPGEARATTQYKGAIADACAGCPQHAAAIFATYTDLRFGAWRAGEQTSIPGGLTPRARARAWGPARGGH